MAREIYDAATNGRHTHLIIKTESAGGGRFSSPAKLHLARVQNRHLGALKDPKIAGNPNIEILETARVDQRNQGPNSHFGRKLEALKSEVSRFVAAGVALDNNVEHVKGPDAGRAVERWAEAAQTMDPDKAIALADKRGSVELRDGVRLSTAEDLQRQDESKDFSKAPYWLSDESKPGLIPVNGAHTKEFRNALESGGRKLYAQDWKALDGEAPQQEKPIAPKQPRLVFTDIHADGTEREVGNFADGPRGRKDAMEFARDDASKADFIRTSSKENIGVLATEQRIERHFSDGKQELWRLPDGHDEYPKTLAEANQVEQRFVSRLEQTPGVEREPLTFTELDAQHDADKRLKVKDWLHANAQANWERLPQKDLEMTPERAEDLADREGVVLIDDGEWVQTNGERRPQEDLEMTPERAVDLADRQGSVEIQGGTWLHTSADLQSEQEGWDAEDESKSMDFSASEYWITTDTGDGPLAISGKDDPDLVECFSEGGRTLTQDEQKALAGGGRQQAQEKAPPTLEGAKVDMSRPFEERLAEMNKLGPMTKEREAERLAAHREEKKQKAQAPAPEARPEAPVKRRGGLDF